MKEIYLLRHGQSTANRDAVLAGWTDVSLTDQGHSQARGAAQRLLALNALGFDAIISSDLTRALQTAAPISEALGLPIIKEPGLRELHLGRWENLSFQEVQQSEPELADQWLMAGLSFCYPEGESIKDVIERAKVVIDGYLEKHDRLLVVAHGGTLAAIIAHYVFGDALHAKGIYLDNACFSRLVFHQGGATLNLLNA